MSLQRQNFPPKIPNSATKYTNPNPSRQNKYPRLVVVITVIRTFSRTVDNVENDTLADELEHPLSHRLYLAQLHVDLPVLLPAVSRHQAQPSQDGPDGSVLRVDTTHRQQQRHNSGQFRTLLF